MKELEEWIKSRQRKGVALAAMALEIGRTEGCLRQYARGLATPDKYIRRAILEYIAKGEAS